MISDEEIVAFVFAFVVYYNSQRVRHCLTRSALIPAKYSPWKRLLYHGDAQSFLNITGFTRDAFASLAMVMREEPVDFSKGGRPKQLSVEDELGLTLLFLNSRAELRFFSMVFGVIPSTASKTIRRTLKKIIRRLRNNEIAAIKFPDENKMHELAALVEAREPAVTNVIGFADGVTFATQCGSEPVVQTEHYSGYGHDTKINNVLVFSSEGKVIYACLNYPGSWHDSQVAAHLFDEVVKSIGDYALCVDSGFPRRGDVEGKLVGPTGALALANMLPANRAAEIARHGVHVSLRQSAEWGMRALQGTFSRLKVRLTANRKDRRDILLAIVLLHNFRTELVGLNQINTVFKEDYEPNINLEPYDRIARYFQFN